MLKCKPLELHDQRGVCEADLFFNLSGQLGDGFLLVLGLWRVVCRGPVCLHQSLFHDPHLRQSQHPVSFFKCITGNNQRSTATLTAHAHYPLNILIVKSHRVSFVLHQSTITKVRPDCLSSKQTTLLTMQSTKNPMTYKVKQYKITTNLVVLTIFASCQMRRLQVWRQIRRSIA